MKKPLPNAEIPESLLEILEVHIVPNARQNGSAGKHGDRLKLRIAAPAQDGRANKELVSFLSEKLAIPKRAIKILRGEKSRDKTLGVRAVIDRPTLDALWAGSDNQP